MVTNLKDIHIGTYIEQRVNECEIETARICNFLKCPEDKVDEMYKQESIDSKLLLQWSKLLNYDFFRLYTQHLILYSPPDSKNANNKRKKASSLPVFRKNIYTKEIIDFVIELIHTGEKTHKQIMEEYRIPKTTLYKWLIKYTKA